MRKVALIIGLLFLSAARVSGQTYVRQTTLFTNSTLTGTFASNTAGNTIIFKLSGQFFGRLFGTGTLLPAVTDSAGNTYRLVGNTNCSNGFEGEAIFEADNIAASAGANTLTLAPGEFTGLDGVGFEYSGLANPAFDQLACVWVTSQTSFNSGSTLKTQVPSELILSTFSAGSSTINPTDGSTIRLSGGSNFIDVWSDRNVSVRGTYAATGTASSTNAIVSVAAFKAAGSNPPASPVLAGPLASGYLPSTSPSCAANTWITDELAKVLQEDALPPTVPCTLTIFGTQNEFVSVQAHFHDTGSGTAGYKVTVGNFVQSAPSVSTINCSTLGQCVVYREAYMNVTLPTAEGTTYYNKLGHYPDILIPATDPYWGQTTNAFPFTITASKNQSSWVDIHIPPTAPTGYYLGAVTIQIGCPGSCATVSTMPVILGVWAWPSGSSMPSTSTLRTEETGFGYDGLCVNMYNGAATGSASNCDVYPDNGGTHDGAIAQIWEDAGLLMKDHRFNEGGLVNNFPGTGSFATYITYASANMNGTSRHGGAVVPLLSGAIQTTRQIGAAGNVFSQGIYSNYQTNFVAQGWGTAGTLPLYDYLFDEPSSGGAWTTINANGAARHAYLAPSVAELVTANIANATTNSALNNIDILVPTIGDMDPMGGSLQRSTYNTWLAGNANNCGAGANQPCAPRSLWEYQACNSSGTCTNGQSGSGTPYPNVNVDGVAVANRAMPWLDYLHNVSGELYYLADACMSPSGVAGSCGFPSHPNDPWISIYYSGGWGDGNLIYAGGTNAGGNNYMGAGVTTPIVLPSIRLKLIRDGLQDYEYLYKLNSLGFGSFISSTISNWLTNSYTFETSGAGLQVARKIIGAQMNALTFGCGQCGLTITPGMTWTPGWTIK